MTPSEPDSFDAIPRSSTDRADGMDSRNRSLERISGIFHATGGPADFIAALLQDHDRLDVLEVGFGWGVALLELACRFRDRNVTFHGVDVEPKPELATPAGIVRWAVEQAIMSPEQAEGFKPPELSFYDASTLQLDDETMDFIYSVVTIRFMTKKIEFIEEVARVLRPGGKALLHIGESNWNYPYSRVCGEPLLTPFTSRLVLKYGDELIPVPAYFKSFESDAFSFQFSEDSRCILILSKSARGRLNLDLTCNAALTLSGRA